MRREASRTSAVIWSVGAVLVVGMGLTVAYDFGLHARRMALHIALMSVAAPLFALFALGRWSWTPERTTVFWAATLVQIGLLWFSHIPAIAHSMLGSAPLALVVHIALLAAAVYFWATLLTLPEHMLWQGILALMLTGKLVCLLAVLFVFSPRVLHESLHTPGHGAHELGDQQLAGLLMLAACPVSYLTAAVLIAVRMVNASAMRPPPVR